MTETVEDDVDALAPAGLRAGRIVTAAILLEVVLFAVLVPIGVLLGQHAIFFTAVAVGCLVFGYLAGRLVVRRVLSQFALHGFLTGVTATALYLGICAVSSAGLSGAVAVYGTALFWTINLLRIVGTTAGAAHARRS